MKSSLRVLLVPVLFACALLAALPVSARVAPASELQIRADGRGGIATGMAGCTRVTNRFCTQSTKSNCFACH